MRARTSACCAGVRVRRPVTECRTPSAEPTSATTSSPAEIPTSSTKCTRGWVASRASTWATRVLPEPTRSEDRGQPAGADEAPEPGQVLGAAQQVVGVVTAPRCGPARRRRAARGGAVAGRGPGRRPAGRPGRAGRPRSAPAPPRRRRSRPRCASSASNTSTSSGSAVVHLGQQPDGLGVTPAPAQGETRVSGPDPAPATGAGRRASARGPVAVPDRRRRAADELVGGRGRRAPRGASPSTSALPGTVDQGSRAPRRRRRRPRAPAGSHRRPGRRPRRRAGTAAATPAPGAPWGRRRVVDPDLVDEPLVATRRRVRSASAARRSAGAGAGDRLPVVRHLVEEPQHDSHVGVSGSGERSEALRGVGSPGQHRNSGPNLTHVRHGRPRSKMATIAVPCGRTRGGLREEHHAGRPAHHRLVC